jgi:hypothetical protein
MAELSDEVSAFFQQKGCRVTLITTEQAVECWNDTKGAGIGLFHVTC